MTWKGHLSILRDMLNCTHHTSCIENALNQADTLCRKTGARLTITRRKILEMLWQSHQPRKAYDLLSELSTSDAAAKPPTVYRALEFLQDMGLVHKVESLNAYIGCNGCDAHQYLICQKCGSVSDIGDAKLAASVRSKAAEHGFQVSNSIIEIKGQCERCVS